MTTPFRAAKRVRTLVALWRHRADLFPMFRDMFNGQYRATLVTKLAMILCALYVVMPLDFIPDFIPFAGWADDAAMIYFMVRRILSEAVRYRAFRQPLKVVRY